MIIPVEVQRPCEPKSARFVGEASDDLTPGEVADRIGVPEGCFIQGKILKGRKGRRWSLVADVTFSQRKSSQAVCPRCGGSL